MVNQEVSGQITVPPKSLLYCRKTVGCVSAAVGAEFDVGAWDACGGITLYKTTTSPVLALVVHRTGQNQI